jgi:5'-3' exonuclease
MKFENKCDNLFINLDDIVSFLEFESYSHESIKQHVFQKLDEIINVTNPINLIYIASNGVPPKSTIFYNKQHVLKKYCTIDNLTHETIENYSIINTQLNTSKYESDYQSNIKFLEYIKEIVNEYINIKKDIKVKIMFSTYLSPSEADIKIISYIRKNYNKQQYNVIYSKSELILYLAMLQDKHITVLNDNLIYNINDIQDKLFSQIQNNIPFLFLSKMNVITDYIYLMFFNGNKTLPRLYDLCLSKNMSRQLYKEQIIKSYVNVLSSEYKYLINTNTDNISINFDILYKIFMYYSIKFNQTINNQNNQNNIPHIVHEYEKYSNHKTYNYLKTTYWNLLYYIKHCPTYNWAYMYYTTPSINDIINYISCNFESLKQLNFYYIAPLDIKSYFHFLYDFPEKQKTIKLLKYNNIKEDESSNNYLLIDYVDIYKKI